MIVAVSHKWLKGSLGHHVHVHVEPAQDLDGSIPEQISLEDKPGSVAVDAGQISIGKVLIDKGEGCIIVKVKVGKVGVQGLERRLVQSPVFVAFAGILGTRLDDEAWNDGTLTSIISIVDGCTSRVADGDKEERQERRFASHVCSDENLPDEQ
jgi:hypothetical protein